MRHRWHLSALAPALLIAAVAATAQETGAPGEPPPEGARPASPYPPEDPRSALPPPPPASSWAVGERPAPVERLVRGKERKVWEAVVAVLGEAEIPVETADEPTHYIKTKLIAFDYRRFQNVALPPPTISKERPLGQRVGLSKGRFSVEIQLAPPPEGRGTRVSVRPYIEEDAFHVYEQRRVPAERWSNGTIETYLLDRIDAKLK